MSSSSESRNPEIRKSERHYLKGMDRVCFSAQGVEWQRRTGSKETVDANLLSCRPRHLTLPHDVPHTFQVHRSPFFS
jgi:hypothetical protein